MKNIEGKQWYRWVILTACCLVYVTSQTVRWNYASITGYLMTDLHIGKVELGLLGSAFFYAYSVGQVPWGWAHDTFGARRVIPVGIAILAFFLAGFAFAATFTQAVGWRMAMGLASAAGFVPNTSLISRWFSIKERAFALNMHSAVGGGLGEVVIFLLVPLVALLLGEGGTIFGLGSWRGSTFFAAIFVLVIAGLAALLMRSDPTNIGLPSIQAAEDYSANANEKEATYRENVIAAIKDPAMWLTAVRFTGFTISCRLLPGWLPLYTASYYIQTQGMGKKEAAVAAGAIVTMMVIGRVFGTPIVGKISDILLYRYKVPRSAVCLVLHLLTATFFLGFTFPMPSVYVIGALSLFAGVTMNSFGLVNATCAEIWSVKTAGFNNGLVNTLGGFGGATALAMSGYWAVKYAGAGGGYWTEFQGIWYLGVINGIVAAAVSIYIMYREKRAIKQHLMEDYCECESEEVRADL